MRWIILITVFTCLSFGERKPEFMEEQLEYQRVEDAVAQRWPTISALLHSNDISTDSFDLFIRVFKFEEDVELWAKDRDSSVYAKLITFKFCSNVGYLGPKTRQGDLQIPEGCYQIVKFNPESNYHLSLKLNYPNRADSLRSIATDLGGMIFIHGGCATIGCIPITDEKIKDLYVACLQARHTGQLEIPVHIYPSRLSDENMARLSGLNLPASLIGFWQELKQTHDLFEQSYQLPSTFIDKRGHYHFQLN